MDVKGQEVKISAMCYAILSRETQQFLLFFVCDSGGKSWLNERKGICFYILSLVKLCTEDAESFPKLIHFHTASDYFDWVATVPFQISFTKHPNGCPPIMEMGSAHPSGLRSLVPPGLSAVGVLQGCACCYMCQTCAFGQAASAEVEVVLGV